MAAFCAEKNKVFRGNRGKKNMNVNCFTLC
jgi:hypothetical protein